MVDTAVLKQFYARMNAAIGNNDLAEIEDILATYPEALTIDIPSGNWLNEAVRRGDAKTIQFFVDKGLSPNGKDTSSGRNALAFAARDGRLDVMAMMLKAGAEMDTATSTANPLLAAINAGSVPVAQMLLDAGIDAGVTYSGAALDGYDATCFALEQGARDVATAIVLHRAGGDRVAAQADLDRAWAIVKANNPNAQSVPDAPVL